MAPAFEKAEYDQRLARVRAEMETRGLTALVIGDPANINWLTGYDAWSFYTPQMMLVELSGGPWWMGRLMDAGAARFTSWLTDDQVVAYPETLVQRHDTHPMDWLAGWMRDNGFATARIGFESDSYFLSPRALAALRAGLPNASFVDADLLVNWLRLIKSPAEIAVMTQAARIAEIARFSQVTKYEHKNCTNEKAPEHASADVGLHSREDQVELHHLKRNGDGPIDVAIDNGRAVDLDPVLTHVEIMNGSHQGNQSATIHTGFPVGMHATGLHDKEHRSGNHRDGDDPV